MFHTLLLDQMDLSVLTEFYWKPGTEVINFDHLARTLAAICPQSMVLEVGDPVGSEPDGKTQTLPSARWSSVRTLLACRNLTTLLLHCCKFPKDVFELADLLSSQRTCHLHEGADDTRCPVDIRQKLPQINILRSFSRREHDCWPHPCNRTWPLVSLSRSNQLFHSLCTHEHITGLAEFLFKLCERPLYLQGQDKRFWHSVSMLIAMYLLHCGKAQDGQFTVSQRPRVH